MLGIVTIVIGHLIVGGLCASALVILSMVNNVVGGGKISAERRLPQDSDSKLFCLLLALGAGCGLTLAAISGFQPSWLWLVPTGSLSLVAGSFVAYRRVIALNNLYLARARANYERGDYKAAIEDASEVARKSQRLQSEANAIIAAARDERYSRPLDEFFASTTNSEPGRQLQAAGGRQQDRSDD